MPKIQLNPNKFKKGLQKKKRDSFHIETGDNLAILKKLNPNQFDAMVTDPPAGISFMGKEWDGDKGSRDEWIRWLATTMAECMRVLKPGAYALVWAIPRTQHWTMMALENAGFVVRDVVYHLFGQGFPKSHNISKAIDEMFGAEREKVMVPTKPGNHPDQAGAIALGATGMRDVSKPVTPEAKKWSGWGSALKPACEPWILVQKPLSEPTIAANVLKHGTGGLNIDGTRIDNGDEKPGAIISSVGQGFYNKAKVAEWLAEGKTHAPCGKDLNLLWFRLTDGRNEAAEIAGAAKRKELGRFPSNVILDEDAAKVLELDEQTAGQGLGRSAGGGDSESKNNDSNMFGKNAKSIMGVNNYNDKGGASRFFYTAKASKAERNYGLESLPIKQSTGGGGLTNVGGKFGSIKAPAQNFHPTVKPISLMKYLITLITPPGGTVLDPFMGSGTTGVAAIKNGFKFFGIDQDKQYTEIARKRLFAVYKIDPKTIKTVRVRGDGPEIRRHPEKEKAQAGP